MFHTKSNYFQIPILIFALVVIFQVLSTSDAHPYYALDSDVQIEPRAYVGDERNWRINIPPEAELKSTTKKPESEEENEGDEETPEGIGQNDGNNERLDGGGEKPAFENVLSGGRRQIGSRNRKQGENIYGSIGSSLYNYGQKMYSSIGTSLYGYGQGLLNRFDSAITNAAQRAKHMIPNLLVHSHRIWSKSQDAQLALPLKKMYAQIAAA